jgi:hypothetical protein
LKKLIVVFLIFSGLYSCEDVIEVDLPQDVPKINIDALFRVDINEEFVPVVVKITMTNSFMNEVPVTNVDNIIIIIEELDEFDRIIDTQFSVLAQVDEGSGIYVPDPNTSREERIRTSILDKKLRFWLSIRHEDKFYLAQTRYVPAVPIENIVQGDGKLFNDDETEVIVTFTDNPERDDFYVFDFDFTEYLVTEDKFYQGQEFTFSYYYDRTFEPGTEIEISIMGSDDIFYSYMDQLIEQRDIEGPFQTPVSTVRGNIFDATGIDNRDLFDNVERPGEFPLGYFAIVQEYKYPLIIE